MPSHLHSSMSSTMDIDGSSAPGADCGLLASDDADHFARNPKAWCRVRRYRDSDWERLHPHSSVGLEGEELWLTFVFPGGVYIADFFAGPVARWFPPLWKRALSRARFYRNELQERHFAAAKRRLVEAWNDPA